MVDAQIYDLSIEALRILFLGVLPFLCVAAIAGSLVAALQSATAIHEPALGYAVRILAVTCACYFILAGIWTALVNLAFLVYR